MACPLCVSYNLEKQYGQISGFQSLLIDLKMLIFSKSLSSAEQVPISLGLNTQCFLKSFDISQFQRNF